MEEKNSILEKLTLDLYLQIVGIGCLFTGFALFIICIWLDINFFYVVMHTNPLFYLIVGISVLLYRYFLKYVEIVVEED